MLGYRVYVLNVIQNGKHHAFPKSNHSTVNCVSDGNNNLCYYAV
jgi:hypothetical protein